jgi:hypothetical protein
MVIKLSFGRFTNSKMGLALLTMLAAGSSASVANAKGPSPVDKELLAQAIFYESGDGLKTTDTRLHFSGRDFSMNQARYQARVERVLGDDAPIEYRYQNHHLAFTPTTLSWSAPSVGRWSSLIKAGVHPVTGRLVDGSGELDGKVDAQSAGKGVIYQDAYGAGLDLGVLTENTVMRKIAKFNRLEGLGPIPAEAEFLELSFELDVGDDVYFKARFGGEKSQVWNRKGSVLSEGEAIEFGSGQHRSFIKQAFAWDSAGNRIPLSLELSEKDGQLTLKKRIPVNWLKSATYPIFADAAASYGTASVFESADSVFLSATALRCSSSDLI